jgi:hypothetical protein
MLVEGLGDLACFPCSSSKKPLMTKWQKRAQRIEPSPHWPRVGVLTGEVNGFDILDLEEQGLVWLASANLPPTRIHITPRGKHFFFLSADNLRGSADLRIHDGVHIRANKNFVVWHPRQGWPVVDAPIAEWPSELLALARGKVDPGFTKETPTCVVCVEGSSIKELQAQCAPLVSPRCREGRYALAAVKNAYAKLANEWPRHYDEVRGRMVWAQGRNNLLNKLAFKLGGLAVNGWIEIAVIVRVLMLAAKSVNLVREDGADCCMATILSGLRAGMARPYAALGDR